MTQVWIRAKHPDKNNYGRYWVDLIGHPEGDAAIDLAEHTIVYRSIIPPTRLPNTGAVLLELDPLSDLTPTGMAYRVSFQRTGQPIPETLVIGGFSGAGPVEATDHILVTPGAVTPPSIDALFVRKITAGALAGVEAGGVVTVSVPTSQWGIYTAGPNAGEPYFNSAGVPSTDAANLHVDGGELVLTLLGA